MTALHPSHPNPPPVPPVSATPVWEVATLFPNQGEWTESAYLQLTADSNRLIELVDGCLEFPPLPKASHQRILRFLLEAFLAFIRPRGLGEMLTSPLRVRLRQGRFREPDLVFMFREHADRAGDDFWEGADLVVEIVSDDGRDRDLVEKRDDYAKAGIGEYWIVDPKQERIEVLALKDESYAAHGLFNRGETATSSSLQGFAVDVSAVLDAANSRA